MPAVVMETRLAGIESAGLSEELARQCSTCLSACANFPSLDLLDIGEKFTTSGSTAIAAVR